MTTKKKMKERNETKKNAGEKRPPTCPSVHCVSSSSEESRPEKENKMNKKMLFCLLHRSNRLSCFAHRVCNVHASIAFRSAIFFHFDDVRVASAVFVSREKKLMLE